jgi:hypothetical protein
MFASPIQPILPDLKPEDAPAGIKKIICMNFT